MAPEQRRNLRARAHALGPVVLVGNAGLALGVMNEIEQALKSHELIKIRVAGAERAARERMLAEICARTGAEPVQHIGRIFVVYRENPDLHRPARAPQADVKREAKKRETKPRRRISPPQPASRRGDDAKRFHRRAR
jgi:RNA-binding protein